jgi:hypothetical protein
MVLAGKPEETLNRIVQLQADDAPRAVEALDGFFREVEEQWRIGYSLVGLSFLT